MTENYCEDCAFYDEGHHSVQCYFCDPPFENRFVSKHEYYGNEDDTNDRDETYNADRG